MVVRLELPASQETRATLAPAVRAAVGADTAVALRWHPGVLTTTVIRARRGIEALSLAHR
jgi:hypothetical protein